jgi:hypothetical protein
MWVEGTLGIVPTLAPKIMLNEEGENITLSNNTEMFKKWADIWEKVGLRCSRAGSFFFFPNVIFYTK